MKKTLSIWDLCECKAHWLKFSLVNLQCYSTVKCHILTNYFMVFMRLSYYMKRKMTYSGAIDSEFVKNN